MQRTTRHAAGNRPVGGGRMIPSFVQFLGLHWHLLIRSLPVRRTESAGIDTLFRSGAVEQQLALAGVAGERCSALKLGTGFVQAAEFEEEIAPHAR